jgi:hypothetical protein
MVVVVSLRACGLVGSGARGSVSLRARGSGLENHVSYKGILRPDTVTRFKHTQYLLSRSDVPLLFLCQNLGYLSKPKNSCVWLERR